MIESCQNADFRTVLMIFIGCFDSLFLFLVSNQNFGKVIKPTLSNHKPFLMNGTTYAMSAYIIFLIVVPKVT